MRDRKKEKEGKINISFFAVPQYTWPLPMCIQNWKTLALIEAKKFVAENLLGEKEKWTNKAMIISSRLILFYTFNDTTNHTQQFVPNFKILGAVVPEKSLTQISLCITLE